MRRRLAASYVLLLVLVLAALDVPLALSLAARETQRTSQSRLSEAVRFATLAEPALHSDDPATIRAELAAYHTYYGIEAALVTRDGQIVVSTGGLRMDAPDVEPALTRALNGQHVGATQVIWPWWDEPLVVAAPVGTGGDVLGAVVTASPVARQRATVRNGWLILTAVGLLALALCVLAAEALARWTLKPVAELDHAAQSITAGDYAARVPARLGPPELRRLTTAFNEMAATVADAMDRQRMFVSQASHQMRNPLTALQLRIEGLGEEVGTAAGRTEHRRAMDEVERLGAILDSLLTLARAERGGYQVERVDAIRVAEARVTAWQPLAEQRAIVLRCTAPDGPIPVTVLATALDQTLDALIDNALKFAGAGARVEVSVAAEDDGVVLHVVDDGPGLSPQDRSRATQRFWRAPGATVVQGSGLGLPIVAVLVEASGGRFELLPATPQGLDARLWLPRSGTVDGLGPAGEPRITVPAS